MFVTRLRTEGLRHAPEELNELTRVVRMPPPPHTCAVADSLRLAAAALRPQHAETTARELGWADQLEVLGDPADGLQLQGLDAAAVHAALSDGQRSITIELDVRLDPPMYGRLTKHAMRDPRIATALGQEPTVSIKAGWLFTSDLSVATPSVLGLRVGDVPFEIAGRDRPAWVPPLIRDTGGRIAHTDPFESREPLLRRLRAAMLAPDPEARDGFRRLVQTIQEPPFLLPEPGLVETAAGLSVAFGPSLDRVRQLGRPALDALRWLEAAMIGRPDILVIPESLPQEVSDWFSALPGADDAPIEQCWLPE